jgi:ATP-dependent Clp protease ATP-binding subunit ClpC
MKELMGRIQINKMTLEFTQAAKDFLVDKGFDEKFGARPLRRALQKYVEDELAELMLRDSLGVGTEIKADLAEDKKKLIFTHFGGVRLIDEKSIVKQILETKEEELETNKN